MTTREQLDHRAGIFGDAIAKRREKEWHKAMDTILERFWNWTAAERKSAIAEIITAYCPECGAGHCGPCKCAKPEPRGDPALMVGDRDVS